MGIERGSPAVRLALLAAALASACGPTEPRRERYDLVVVLVDTLRADRLGAYGHERPTSPAIDALAAEGILFERCMAQSTWTKPTVASILTGELPGEHGVHRYTSRLSESATTLAELLCAEGYRTAAFVANDMVGAPEDGLAQGFERYASDLPREPGFPYPRAAVVVDHALAWLDEEPRGDDPFYLHVHLCDPHAPYDPPEPHRARFDRGLGGEIDGFYPLEGEDASPEALAERDWQHLLDLYDGEVAYVDAEVRRLLDGLRERGLDEDALVVLVADHGEEFGEHDHWMHNSHMYQEVVHVPLILRPPTGSELPRGRRVDALAMQVDLLPTVCDLFGLPVPDGLAGASLLPRALAPDDAPPGFAYAEVQNHGHVRRSVFAGDWKRVRAEAPEALDLLFDLRTDPREREDRFGREPGAVDALDRLMADVVARGDAPQPVLFEVVNARDRARRVEVHVGVDPVAVGLDTRALELEADPAALADGPVRAGAQDWGGGVVLPTASLLLSLPAGDVDRFSITFAEGTEEFRWSVLEDGAPLPAEAVGLGARGARPEGPPYVLEPTDTRLAGAPGDAAAAGRLTVRAWSVAGAAADEPELDPERRAQLEALGYTGDE